MADIGGVNPLRQAFETCLAGDHLCAESEQAAIETALNEAIRTDLGSIPQTLNWLYQESKGTVAEPIRRMIEQKLTTAYSDRLLARANDADGLTTTDFEGIYDTLGLQQLMNRFGAGAINLFFSNVMTLAATGTRVYIDAGILTYLENELIDDGVNNDLMTRYKSLGITQPEIKTPAEDESRKKVRKPPRETAAQKAARLQRARDEQARKDAEAARGAPGARRKLQQGEL